MTAVFEPYVGPRPFEQTEADRNRFFGRNDEANDLLSCVIAHAAVLLYAPSGAGKTSLINAKLTPMLEDEGLEVLKPARVRDVPPADSVLRKISNIYTFNVLRCWTVDKTDPETLAGMSLSEFLTNRKREVNEGEDPKPHVAIFDQFEELFTSYQGRSADREDFFDQVGAALADDRLLRVVFAMREDYIAELDPYVSLLPEKLRTRYRIQRLSENDSLLAITEPLRGSHYSYADGVAEQLVENLLTVPVETAKGIERVRGESVEPVQLQVVCQNLWENCEKSWKSSPNGPRVITRKYLEEFGDVDQALSDFYQKAINSVVAATPVKEGLLRRWFEQNLITSAGTRGTVFRGPTETGEISNAAVDKLVDQHIIRAELRGGSRWYELTHDRFIAPIKASNERWFREHSGGDQTPKRLEARAEQWVRDGRTKADLLDEGELLEARRWLESPSADDVGYSDALFALVQASRAASEETARERERIRARAAEVVRLRWLVAGLALMFLLAVGAMAWALRNKSKAAAARTEAEINLKLASDRAAQLELANQRAEGSLKEADAQAQLAKTSADKAIDAIAASKRAEMALAAARLAKIRSEKKAAADTAQNRSNFIGAMAQTIETPEHESEALGVLDVMLTVYENLNDPDGQIEILTRKARRYRLLGKDKEADDLDKRIEDIRRTKKAK